MNQAPARLAAIMALLVVALVAALASSQDGPKDKSKPARAKTDPAVIRKLVNQLKSGDFRKREAATKELAKLEEVPDALREATTSSDAEVRGRAQNLVKLITARREAREFQAIAAALQTFELDRLVRRMATDEKTAGAKEWNYLSKLAKGVTKKANDLAGRQFKVPDFDLKSLSPHDRTRRFPNRERIFFHNATEEPTWVGDSLILSEGPMPKISVIRRTLVLVDGDFTGANWIDSSLLIVRGNIRAAKHIHDSIILATGDFAGNQTANDSFFQVGNRGIPLQGQNGNFVYDLERGPLQMLKFSAKKGEAPKQRKK